MEEEIKEAYFWYCWGLYEKSIGEKLIPLIPISKVVYILCCSGIVHSSYPKFKDDYLKQKEMEKTTTIKNEVTWLRQALSIQGIEIHEKIIEVMIESYKLILEKGNKTTFKDALEVTKEINRRNKITIKYYTK